MKLIIVLSLLASSSLFAETRVLKNVSICATKCQSAVLGIISHDLAKHGEVFIAEYSRDNATNTNICMSVAGDDSVSLAGDRGASEGTVGINADECVEIMKGKYFGKNVTIETEEIDGQRYATKIYPTKK